MRLFGVILCVLLLPVAALAQPSQSFDVAYLHPNGSLFPLFYYEDGQWSKGFEARLPDVWIHVMRSGVEWTIPRGPKALDGSGGYQTGLRSRQLEGNKPSGLAVSPEIPVIGFDQMDPEAEEATQLLEAMRIPFDGFEMQQVDARVNAGGATQEISNVWFVEPGVPVSARTRKRTPLSFHALWRSRKVVGSGTLYYLQLQRTYEGPDCPGKAMLTAWVSDEPGGLSILEEHVTLGTCEDEGLEPTLEPLGVVAGGRDTFVVVQEAVGAAKVLHMTTSGMQVVLEEHGE